MTATFSNGRAHAEGWRIERVEGIWCVKALEDRPDFADDAEAVVHVWEKALEGSDYHARAVQFLVSREATPFCDRGVEIAVGNEVHSEGWFLSNTSGASNGDRYQLQRSDEMEIFEEDNDAWVHVAERAAEGSAPHARALRFLEIVQPNEAKLIADHVSSVVAAPSPTV